MSKFYISFGQCHVHRIGGFTYDCDVLMGIRAETYQDARAVAHALTGGVFGTSYTDEDIKMEHFPNGVHFLADDLVRSILSEVST